MSNQNPQPYNSDTYYAIGRLLHALESGGWLDNDDMAKASHAFLPTIVPAIRRATTGGSTRGIENAMGRIGELPDTLTNEQWSTVWLGYYNARAGKDRSPTVPTERKTERFNMLLTPRQKAWLMENGGSDIISRWIDDAMGPPPTPEE